MGGGESTTTVVGTHWHSHSFLCVVPNTGDDNRCFQHDPAKPYIGPDFTLLLLVEELNYGYLSNIRNVIPKTGDDDHCFQHDPATKPYIGPDFRYEFAVFLKFLQE
ncbi:hypothetical protein GBA52_024458 [Prunus armeniaca]|nr:hypothetical protein GBA52_024458 [Prunus armeniaca]